MVNGARILERMEAAGLSQAELARRVGLSQPTIYNLIHRGKKGSTKLHIIARELRTTPAYLTGETDDPTAELPDDFLTSQDRGDIALLQRLPDTDRDAIRQLMRTIVERTGMPNEPTLHSPVRTFTAEVKPRGSRLDEN